MSKNWNNLQETFPADETLKNGYFACPNCDAVIRRDNHAARSALQIRSAGLACSWTWVPAKTGCGIYDEGIAFLCIGHKITAAESFYISSTQDYQNWKTRKVLSIQIEGRRDWFYTVHMGWRQDEEEPFQAQWDRLESRLQQKNKTLLYG